MSESSKEDTLAQIMTSPVKTVNSSDELSVAAQKMVKNDIGAVVVVEDKTPLGILTERDIIRQVLKGNNVLRKPAEKVMSKPLVTATPGTSIEDAFELMLRNKIRRLPVLEGNKLVGIVTERDLMRWVLRVSYEPDIPPHIKAILKKA